MRVVLDTNVLVSALISRNAPPAKLAAHWRRGAFDLLTCEEQMAEFRAVTRYPKIRERLVPAHAGELLNELRAVAGFVTDLPELDVSPDPWDNYLLALAQAGRADVLVTGDKRDLIALGKYGSTEILGARQLLERLDR